MLIKHIVSVSQFTKHQIISFIERASFFKENPCTVSFPHKTLITMFFEPSTRTSASFQAAAYRLGCKVITLSDQFSSTQKGESLEDTIKTISYYGDAVALRHPQKGAAQLASTVSKIPVINAGDGTGEHPTQALLDIFTIYSELKKRNIDLLAEVRPAITITFVGDLKHSRTIHSLVHILAMFPNIRFIYIAPPTLEMPTEIVDALYGLNISQTTNITLYEAMPQTDVFYITRIQKERFPTMRDYYGITLSHAYKNYCINHEIIKYAPPSAIIMHPLPRTTEITPEIDNDPRAVYFTQVENGVYMRMAILEYIFGHV
jgi:aspartate carbamoyltransferase